jgi:glycosyltransferase involved in cell wall biosynthesis
VRIGIDVRYLSHGIFGGVQRYVANIVPALLANGPQHEFLLYADTKGPFELPNLPSNATLRLLPYRSPLSTITNDLFMSRTLAQDKLDVMHFPANYGVAPREVTTLITLHDEINILPWREIIRGHPKKLGVQAKMAYLHFFTSYSLRRIKLLITDSEYSRRNILKHSHFTPDQVRVVSFGPASSFHKVTDESMLSAVRERHGLTKPFILGDALKNAGATIQAWQQLPAALRDSMQMVFFCRNPQPPPATLPAIESGQAKVLIRPSSEDLMALYSMARAFVFPTWIEGLGLPVLEAMIGGAPVIASDRGSVPEVVGKAGLLVDAEDIDGLARHLTQVLTDPAEADRLRQAGYSRAADYSWDRAAQQILQIYAEAHAKR